MPKNRRGLSSVVGALFFTILMVSGFSVLSLALDAQTDIVTTQRVISDIEIKKQQEQFGVLASVDGNDILNVSIQNQGQYPVEISSMWIINKTLSDQPVKRYAVNYDDAYVPSGFTNNVLLSKTLQMIPDTYDIKIISAFGSIKTVELDTIGGDSSSLRAEMITDPPDPVIGKNVTTAMIVTNTGNIPITNVSPNALDTTTSGMGTITTSPPVPSGVATLNSGASVMFTWDSKVTGDSGDVLSFLSSATGDGPVTSNPASDTSLLRLAGEGGGSPDPDIVNDDLFARPQLFFVIPSSQGEASTATALWGVNVVNPVNAPMDVTKLIITAFAPGGNDNNKIFRFGGGDCSPLPTSVYPATGTWSCPSENALMWKSSIPVTIPANSTKSFLAQVQPGAPSGNVGLESITVQGSVFTSLGSFGKSGYQSTMSAAKTSIVNVFLAKDLLGSDHRDSGNIDSTRINITPNSLETFHMVFADMDSYPSTQIESGARFIINVPKEWTDVDVTAWTGFSVEPPISSFGDGSHQIVGTTTSRFGDNDISISDNYRTITFEARAPTISVGTDQLYIMYVLAQGETTHTEPFTVGPLAEIVLQVHG
jgi:hypothetical protein